MIKCPICGEKMLCKIRIRDDKDGDKAEPFYVLNCSYCEYKTRYMYKTLDGAVKECLCTTKNVEKVVREVAVETVSDILNG